MYISDLHTLNASDDAILVHCFTRIKIPNGLPASTINQHGKISTSFKFFYCEMREKSVCGFAWNADVQHGSTSCVIYI